MIIGEGGSEGALALGLSDRILMQQYAVYSPISLNHNLGVSYHDHRLDREAAEALMLTAQDCLELGIADQVVPEPAGGAHLNPKEAADTLQIAILKHLAELGKLSLGKLLKKRYQKFRRMGESSSYSHEAMTRGSGTADEYYRFHQPQWQKWAIIINRGRVYRGSSCRFGYKQTSQVRLENPPRTPRRPPARTPAGSV